MPQILPAASLSVNPRIVGIAIASMYGRTTLDHIPGLCFAKDPTCGRSKTTGPTTVLRNSGQADTGDETDMGRDRRQQKEQERRGLEIELMIEAKVNQAIRNLRVP